MVKKRQLQIQPAGAKKQLKLAVLEMGADILQNTDPLKNFDIYVVGFHCMKHDPTMQMEAHHYCSQVNNDFLQCVVFDGNTEQANLIGVEYIISEQLFETLPDEERKFWHPHNYEILSGSLVAPGIPDPVEKTMLKLLMNSYGKVWHLWHTGRPDGKGEPGHELPLGEPMLMWSFNRDGEMDESLKENIEDGMQISMDDKRRYRQDLVEHAHPQEGVDALLEHFPHSRPVQGVVEKKKGS